MKNRSNTIQDLKTLNPQLIIIGGGITGAGIFVDAQSRGISTLLVEMQDFAGGTSSRSTKLIHGGLRYLKQLDFKVVKQTGRERKVVKNIAPHLTQSIRVRLPIQKNGSLGKFSTKLALTAYEYLAQVEGKDKHDFYSSENLTNNDKLEPEGLKGAYDYLEYQTDDSRLTIENIKKGVELGGTALNYCKVEAFIYSENGQIAGVKLRDQLSGEHYETKCEHVISATGPWVDEVCRFEDAQKPDKLILTKGVHLVFKNEDFPLTSAYYFDTADHRMIFTIPYQNVTYVGTTDTIYTTNKVDPHTSKEDVAYLLKNITNRFQLKLTENQIISSWSGLRPLIQQAGKGPSEISRKDEIFISEAGLYSIAGGKLTGYRLMAQKILDKLIRNTSIQVKPCTTDLIKLSGGDFKVNEQESTLQNIINQGLKVNVNEIISQHLFSKFGTNAIQIFNLLKTKKENFKTYNCPSYILASLHYCLENEFVIHPTDFAIRRMGMLYFEPQLLSEVKMDIVNYMTDYYSWSTDIKILYTEELETSIYHSTNFK